MLKISALRLKNQRGDTIVEVLISIAIVSMVLGGAYVTTNRSLIGTRVAQERSDGLKVTESQLEAVKSMAVSNPTVLYGTATANGAKFCMSNATVVSSTNAACKVNAAGTATTVAPAYNITITRATDASTTTFTIKTVWDNLRGATDNVQMSYRVYSNE
jgi:Tfp pilus assembly protein PilV